MNMPLEQTVMILGIVLVGLMLLLLALILHLEGKFSRALSAMSVGFAPPARSSRRRAGDAPAAPAQPAVQVGPGVPAEVVAVIAAAVHEMGNGGYTLRAVRRADPNRTGSRGVWGRAGVAEATAPF